MAPIKLTLISVSYHFSLSLSVTHTHTLSHTLSHTHTLSLTHTHSLSLSHSFEKHMWIIQISVWPMVFTSIEEKPSFILFENEHSWSKKIFESLKSELLHLYNIKCSRSKISAWANSIDFNHKRFKKCLISFIKSLTY